MKIKIKALSIILALVLTSAVFSACSPTGGDEPLPQSSALSSSDQSSSTPQAVEAPKPIVNPLTGEAGYDEAMLKQRPVAVMINNIGPALPQSGIGDAGVIYEMSAEGSVTRLMAVYSDYKSLPTIGSIRSARHDFVELVKPLNAVYLHFGGSDSGKQAIANNQVDSIDGTVHTNTAFYMDKERAKTKSSDHCWFSNAKLLQAGIDKKSIDMAQSEAVSLFNFALPDVEAMADATMTATDISAQITSGSKAGFKYDEATKLYSKTQNDKPHIDQNKGEAVAFTNVFLMYTRVGLMADNYHKEIDLAKGTGYYISRGKAIEVTYKKSAIDDTIRVYGMDGTELSVNAGKSYFGICDTSLKEKLLGITG